MPDQGGKFRGISVPDVPWCRDCGLVKCSCAKNRPPFQPGSARWRELWKRYDKYLANQAYRRWDRP